MDEWKMEYKVNEVLPLQHLYYAYVIQDQIHC